MDEDKESDAAMLARLGVNANHWAEAFKVHFGNRTPDKDTLSSWFANAICAGIDHERREQRAGKVPH